MELKDQLCSLEFAKKFEKLGVKQDGLYFWVKSKVYGWMLATKNNTFGLEKYSAYTVAELGKILAEAFKNIPGTMINDPRGYFKRAWQKITGFEDEADNRAKILIYLIENKLYDPTQRKAPISRET